MWVGNFVGGDDYGVEGCVGVLVFGIDLLVGVVVVVGVDVVYDVVVEYVV